MRVLVATDAWHPQVNGVVRTYERLAVEAGKLGFEIVFLAPSDFRTLPCPTYPEIRLALAGPRAIAAHIERVRPDFIHIATEGPIGLMTQALLPQDGDGRSPRAITRDFPNMSRRGCRCRSPGATRCSAAFTTARAATFVATPSVAGELRGARLRAADAVVARRRHRAVPPAQGAPVRQRAGVSLCRAHRRREEHQGLSRSRSSWPQGAGGASGRKPAELRTRSIPTRCSPGRSTARTSRSLTPQPTSSCFRASPILSASCCSRPWRVGCRSRASR